MTNQNPREVSLALSLAFERCFGSHAAKLAQALFDRILQFDLELEWPVTRDPEVSFNRRPARLAQLVIDGQPSPSVKSALAAIALPLPSQLSRSESLWEPLLAAWPDARFQITGARELLSKLPRQNLDGEKNVGDTSLNYSAISGEQEPAAAVLLAALALDDARHLHMNSLSDLELRRFQAAISTVAEWAIKMLTMAGLGQHRLVAQLAGAVVRNEQFIGRRKA